MTENNPYAPPKTTEPEADSLRYWQCYGERVLARNGATLPQVDLETGASGVPMTAVSRTYQGAGASQGMRAVMLVVVYLIARNFLHTDSAWLLWALVGGSVLLNSLLRIRGAGGGLITIWEYQEAERQRRRTLRRKVRSGMIFLALFLIIAGPWLIAPAYPMDLYLLAAGVGLLIVKSLWAWMDRPKAASESAPQHGWMRIRNVHPEAMTKLRAIEEEELQSTLAAGAPRVRRVFTNFYHRYPMGSLLGLGRKNPLTVLLIFLMKIFRSKRLERESFEFEEATPVPLNELHEKLRGECESWLAAHPDWQLLATERLPFPAGDIVLESAFLASGDLKHLAGFHYSWTVRNENTGTLETSFLSWLPDGKILHTTHMPLLPITRPDVAVLRVSGSDEEIFRAHLQRCEGLEIEPARDREECIQRLNRERRAMNDFLETAGYRGPTREAV